MVTMPCICIREAKRRHKHRLEDVKLDLRVSELKARAAEVFSIPACEQNLIYGGQIMKDNNPLVSYGLKDGCTVYVLKKIAEPEPVEQDKDNVSMDDVMQVLEAAIKSPTYRNTVEKILTNPDLLEQLVAATPGLSDDPVAMTLLQDQELLQQVIETADIEMVVQQHPSLVQAASYIAAATATEAGGSSSLQSQIRSMMTNDMDEDMRDIEPGLMAQAEMVAANEEHIQAAQAARAQAVTPSMLASALASAGLPTSQSPTTPREGPSTSTGPSTSAGPSSANGLASSSSGSRSVTRNLFSRALSSAMGSSSSGSSTPPTSTQLQGQLQQLRDMGITDDEVSLHALRATGGDVQAALELIFGGT